MTIDQLGRRTVGAAFLDQAAAHPDSPALTIYRGSSETEHPTLTYAELATRAGRRAEALRARVAPGERVVIALPSSTEFVELYVACLLAGLVAVPTPPLGGSAAATERVAVIVGDCSPGLVFTTASGTADVAERLRSLGLGHVPVEEPGDAGADGTPPGAPSEFPEVSPDTLAVLQYSSGSTGSPKGVMLNHGNVLANVAGTRLGHGYGAGDVFANWMPLHHDYSLFMQLSLALTCGAPSVLMPPTVFVRRPVEWFRMLDRFRATTTGAPNFAFDLCLRLIREEDVDGLDLSTVSCIVNGAEPIHVPTMTAFLKRFARIGLRPESNSIGYGMAEATCYISGGHRDLLTPVLVADPRALEATPQPRLVPTTSGTGKEIVGVGVPPSHQMRIVEPQTRAVLPDGEVGELWVRGASVGLGYWDKPELSAETFGAHLADETDDAPGWLRTGDLGAVVDGELYITGRLKEMLIVRGRNLYPHDLERQAGRANPALDGRVGAAFGVDAPDERIVLIQEVNPGVRADDLPAVADDVLRHLTTSLGLPVRNVLLVKKGTVRRTTSGKIQRRAMRQQFLAGGVTALYSVLDPGVRSLLRTDPR
ncbi:fatty acyl-AMP ligase [Dactylosporangium sp. NPDC006015]|uniref:fatty acyl-AMP ligase n=1 Tax=Dactylosporangium sp. NPDC006015 TaxID=3154576 RepID=UPI0033A62A11